MGGGGVGRRRNDAPPVREKRRGVTKRVGRLSLVLRCVYCVREESVFVAGAGRSDGRVAGCGDRSRRSRLGVVRTRDVPVENEIGRDRRRGRDVRSVVCAMNDVRARRSAAYLSGP